MMDNAAQRQQVIIMVVLGLLVGQATGGRQRQ